MTEPPLPNQLRTGAHTDFWQVTKDGLDWALEASALDQDPELRERLLQLYWELSCYPEVPKMLADLKAAGMNTRYQAEAEGDDQIAKVSIVGLGMKDHAGVAARMFPGPR